MRVDLGQIFLIKLLLCPSCTLSYPQPNSNTNECLNCDKQDDKINGREDAIKNLTDVDNDQTYRICTKKKKKNKYYID